MTKLDEDFIKRELRKRVGVSRPWSFFKVSDVKVDGKNLLCVVDFAGAEKYFKMYILKSASVILWREFHQLRLDSRGHKEKVEVTTNAPISGLAARCQDPRWAKFVAKIICGEIREKCRELSDAGELGFSDEEIDVITVEVNSDSIDRIRVSEDDVRACHAER